jgi:hypothetical protein
MVKKPRPEFNNDNPLLVYFRAEVTRWENPCRGDYLLWLDGLRPGMKFGPTGREATVEHFDHARRVLSKLVSLRG